jgi:transcription factor SPN1
LLLDFNLDMRFLLLANKIRLDMQIEAILKAKKSRPKKRKKDAEEEVLDRFADEEVSRLRELMLAATLEDIQANKDKVPATAKLKLLPQVMEVLRK